MGNAFQKVKENRVLMNGLDGSGKTTLLYKWKLDEVVTTIPTIGFNVESIKLNKTSVMTAWDVGGRDKIRPLYRHYYQNTDAVIWVVDSNDRDRLEQSRDEISNTLHEDELRNIPLLVLCNKQDLPNAKAVGHLTDVLGLNQIRDRRIRVLPISATQGRGVDNALVALDDLLKSPIPKSLEAPTISREDADSSAPPMMPKHAVTERDGNQMLQSFSPIKNGTLCPFAKAAKLWGGSPHAVGKSLEDQAKEHFIALRRFVHECQQESSQNSLDGFCIEVDDEQARGGDAHEFGECVRILLTAISDLDPKRQFIMRKSFIGERGWRFRFGGLDFFVTTFAPCYSNTHSRYAFGTGRAFLLLQPEQSFLHKNLPPDNAVTNWDKPQNIRENTRVAFAKAGRPYYIPATTKYPPAEHIVKPLHDDGVHIVKWWEPLNPTKDDSSTTSTSSSISSNSAN
mmetsp:Transcript_18462/g.39862  ORF Transcript_18462/g.39862 Transcript_18462/m.39862 type:complete len:454 (+) Transcript_18462:20-1381(+)